MTVLCSVTTLMQHWQQTEAGSHCAARKLWSSCHYWNLGGCDWSVTIDGYRLSRRDRWKERSRGVTLYIRRYTKYEELPLNNSYEQIKSPWVRIRDRGTKGTLWMVLSAHPWWKGPCWWSLLAPATGSIMLAGSCPAGALQSFQNLLGKQHSKLQARQKTWKARGIHFGAKE